MAIVSLWKLSSDGTDSVGTNNGVSTAVVYKNGGPNGKYGEFSSATASKVLIPDTNTLTFTNGIVSHSYFIYKTDTSSAFLLSKNGTSASEWTTYVAAGNAIASTFYNSTQGIKNQGQAGSAISTGKWYHVIISHNNTSPDIYINGNKQATSVNVGSGTIINTTEPVSIGRRDVDNAFPLNGGLCRYMVRNTVTTAGQAKTEFSFLRGYI